jgi:hypothetical protein
MPAKGHPAWAAAEKNRRRTPKMRAAVVESFFDATIFSNLGSSNSDTNKKVQRWKPENRNSRKLLSDKGIRKARKGRVGKGKEKEGRKKEGLEDKKTKLKER